jgi:hypothetical protein
MYRERTNGVTRLTGSMNVALRAWPIGALFFSDGLTNPAEMLGGGTWELSAQGDLQVGSGTVALYVWRRTA